jgi:hypothetical protein
MAAVTGAHQATGTMQSCPRTAGATTTNQKVARSVQSVQNVHFVHLHSRETLNISKVSRLETMWNTQYLAKVSSLKLRALVTKPKSLSASATEEPNISRWRGRR